MNNGQLQARIAYKVSPSGEPIDINGQLTSISGKKQAIAVMQGVPNPNPALYEIELTFIAGQFIAGTPTTYVNFSACPVSIFTIDANTLVLHPGNIDEVVNIYASFGWQFVGPFPYATANPSTGGNANTAVTIARTSTLGQGYMNFRDNTTGEVKSIYVVNTDALGWILETRIWNNLRFWSSTGVWNY